MRRILSLTLSFFYPFVTVSIYGSEVPFVTCRLTGQLANNMNQIATTMAYAWDYDVEAFFPELDKSEWNISYNCERFFSRINASPLPRPIQNYYNEYDGGGGWWDCNPVPFKPDLYLIGDFFCWKHFHHYRERFVDLFAPSPEVLTSIRNRYSDLLNHPNSVSVHVRTYNKEYHDSVMRFIGLEYYEKSLNLFPKDTLFVVFSDRINWCKEHFPSFKKKFIFIERGDHIEEFFLMSMLKNHIISNSCYSWWAAYLNNQDKVVIAPKRTGRLLEDLNKNIYFPDWILVDPNLDEPYPKDMKDFDAYSQSVDTQ